MKKYKDFIKKINEEDSFDEYKDKLEQDLKNDVEETELEETEIEDTSNDNIIDSIQKEIENFEIKKDEIQGKIGKIEELLTDGEFEEDKKTRLEEEKTRLEEELTDFDGMLGETRGKLDKLKGE